MYRYLVKIGTPRRDPAGNLVSSGEDLNQGGITEWCFDVLYVTCGWWCFVYQLSLRLSLTLFCIGLCQVGSAIFGERFWFLYLSVSVTLYDSIANQLKRLSDPFVRRIQNLD